MSVLHAILQPEAAPYWPTRQGMWDLVSPTSTHHPSPPRQRSLAPTPPAGTPDRPSLAHGSHDGGGYIWRR